MIARKPQKFSLNPKETNSEQLHKEKGPYFSENQRKKKSAADTATSILEELGVKKTSEKKKNKNNLLNVKRKSAPIKKSILGESEWNKRILKDLKNEKSASKKIKGDPTNTRKTESRQTITKQPETKQERAKSYKDGLNGKFGFQEKFVILTMSLVFGIAVLGFIGGYLKIFDLAIFHQLVSGNVHQLEFMDEFEARKVENGYNRIPLFVVEGSIRNSFFRSDQVTKIQLKVLAFDDKQHLLSSHFTLAGVVLSDKQLRTFSPMNIKSLRYSGDMKAVDSNAENDIQKEYLIDGDTGYQEVPFQVVFFKDVSAIKRTSLQIVSYVRKNELVYVRSSGLN